ncbi:MAG: HAMP domain-containing histidine kinase [Gammaproteobacteria bacterium]|nr:HAMP domain-containing histidine kinase [Gammaproteobacteria bacterium]
MKFELQRLAPESEFLGSLDNTALAWLNAHSQVTSLAPGDLLLEEGGDERAMYLILEGRVLVFRKSKQIAVLGPGQTLGEMSLIDERPRSASVRVEEPTRVIRFTAEHFSAFMAHNPAALTVLLRTLSRRIRADLEIMSRDLQRMGMLAHDMRNCLTPLSLVQSFLEELGEQRFGDRELGERLATNMSRITRLGENLGTLIHQSLDRVRSLEPEPQRETFDLCGALGETLAELRDQPPLRGVELGFEAPNRPLVLHADRFGLQSVLQNLVLNAAVAVGPGGTIRVGLHADGERVQVEVTDNGPGVDPEIVGDLFVVPVSTRGEGTGLGLVSCRDVIEERHGGRIGYREDDGKTVFYFTLPRTADAR